MEKELILIKWLHKITRHLLLFPELFLICMEICPLLLGWKIHHVAIMGLEENQSEAETLQL